MLLSVCLKLKHFQADIDHCSIENMYHNSNEYIRKFNKLSTTYTIVIAFNTAFSIRITNILIIVIVIQTIKLITEGFIYYYIPSHISNQF